MLGHPQVRAVPGDAGRVGARRREGADGGAVVRIDLVKLLGMGVDDPQGLAVGDHAPGHLFIVRQRLDARDGVVGDAAPVELVQLAIRDEQMALVHRQARGHQPGGFDAAHQFAVAEAELVDLPGGHVGDPQGSLMDGQPHRLGHGALDGLHQRVLLHHDGSDVLLLLLTDGIGRTGPRLGRAPNQLAAEQGDEQ